MEYSLADDEARRVSPCRTSRPRLSKRRAIASPIATPWPNAVASFAPHLRRDLEGKSTVTPTLSRGVPKPLWAAASGHRAELPLSRAALLLLELGTVRVGSAHMRLAGAVGCGISDAAQSGSTPH